MVSHSDGTTEVLSLNHSFAEDQIPWFRYGSMLNYLFRQGGNGHG